jgi:hypothetical protein
MKSGNVPGYINESGEGESVTSLCGSVYGQKIRLQEHAGGDGEGEEDQNRNS